MASISRWWLFLILIAVLSCGCARTSPAVGSWLGEVKIEPPKNAGMMGMATMMLGQSINGPCQLTLKPDGTGFMKISIAPEAPILWSEEDGKVIIRKRFDTEKTPDKKSEEKSDNGTLVGTMSEEKQALTLDLGITKVEMNKQTAEKSR